MQSPCQQAIYLANARSHYYGYAYGSNEGEKGKGNKDQNTQTGGKNFFKIRKYKTTYKSVSYTHLTLPTRLSV